MVEESFFVGGAALSRIKEWLGEPLGSAYGPDSGITVRVTHVTAGVPHDVQASDDDIEAKGRAIRGVHHPGATGGAGAIRGG